MEEFFAESFDSMFVTLLIAESCVCTEIIFILSSLLNFILMLEDISMQIVEGSACWLASVIAGSLQCLRGAERSPLLLSLLDSLKVLRPDLILAHGVETIMSRLIPPIIHHVHKLD